MRRLFSPTFFRIWSLLLLVCLLAGCRSSHSLSTDGQAPTGCLSSRVLLTIPHKGSTMTLNGTMKLVDGQRLQLSLLMPLLRTEVVRLELTPDEALLVDRMGKRYVQATRGELAPYLPRKATFARLQKMLHQSARRGAKRSLTAAELGLPALDGARIELTDFSDRPLTLTPTRLSGRYRRVSLEELASLLTVE